jgi:hypothetical protein
MVMNSLLSSSGDENIWVIEEYNRSRYEDKIDQDLS